MSWEFFTAPKSAGDMLTNQDSRELFEAFRERRLDSSISVDVPVVTHRFEDQNIHSLIASLGVNYVANFLDAANPNHNKYSTAGAAYKTSQDLLFQAGLDLGYSESFLDEIHPSITALERGDMLSVHYFNICRQALLRMEYRTVQYNSLGGVPKSGNPKPTIQEAIDSYLAEEGSFGLITTFFTGIRLTFSDSTSQFQVIGRKTPLEYTLPNNASDVMIRYLFRSASFLTYFKDKIIVEESSFSMGEENEFKFIDMPFKEQGTHQVTAILEAYEDPTLIPGANRDSGASHTGLVVFWKPVLIYQ